VHRFLFCLLKFWDLQQSRDIICHHSPLTFLWSWSPLSVLSKQAPHTLWPNTSNKSIHNPTIYIRPCFLLEINNSTPLSLSYPPLHITCNPCFLGSNQILVVQWHDTSWFGGRRFFEFLFRSILIDWLICDDHAIQKK
jgi:hypothetical protein